MVEMKDRFKLVLSLKGGAQHKLYVSREAAQALIDALATPKASWLFVNGIRATPVVTEVQFAVLHDQIAAVDLEEATQIQYNIDELAATGSMSK